MRIAQVTLRYPPAIGGVENHVNYLTEELSKTGHSVTVYTSFLLDNASEDLHLLPRESKNGYEIRRYEFSKLLVNRDSTYIAPRIFSDIKRENPDIIHVHGYRFFPVYAAIVFKYFSNIPIVATLHHNPDLNATLLQRLHDLVFTNGLKKFRTIIAVTDFERQFFAKKLRSSNVLTIPNGIPDRFIEICDGYQSLKRSLKSQMGFDEKFIMTYLGRVIPSKNLEVIIKALHAISDEERKKILFVICGPADSDYKFRISSLADSLGVSDNITFSEPIYDHGSKARLLCASDLFVFPSISEVFGIVILECFAAGLPVLASNLPTISSFVGTEPAVWLVDPHDYNKWAAQITALMHEDLSAKRIMASRKKAQCFKWSFLVNQILDSYLLPVVEAQSPSGHEKTDHGEALR